MKYTRRTALGIVGLCLAMMLNTAIAENAWAVDIYPTKIEINDHVPQLNDGSYQEIEKSAYKTSMSADLAKVAVTEMTKTLKAKPEKDTFTSYVRLDKEELPPAKSSLSTRAPSDRWRSRGKATVP